MNESTDPLHLALQSRPTGQTEEGREVRLVGPPILAQDDRLIDASVPAELRAHPLLQGKYFYTLPQDVWELLRKEMGANAFDEELFQVEWDLSLRNGDHSNRVGFFRELPITFQGLRSMPKHQWSDEQVRATGMTKAQVDHALRVMQERDEGPMKRFRLGYIGWLLTNSLFLQEHDRLLTTHLETVRRYGTRGAGSLAPTAPGGLNEERLSDPEWHAFHEAAQPFLLRWRLSGLAGPYLPEPMMPLMAGVFPLSAIERLMETGGVFFLPDTVPIPSRDELRGMLNDVLHRDDHPAHLDEWMEMARADNPARNQLDRFARWPVLVHFCRILRDRHPGALKRNLGRFETAMGKLLGTSKSTIHQDLVTIRERIGEAALARTLAI